jgi:hypothetical protein
MRRAAVALAELAATLVMLLLMPLVVMAATAVEFTTTEL